MQYVQVVAYLSVYHHQFICTRKRAHEAICMSILTFGTNRIDFFKNNGGAVMVVRWKGPDTLDKEESLPAFHFASTVQGSTVPTVGATGKVGGSPGGNEGVETGFGSGERGGEAVELPSPAAVGMRPGFLGQLFFLGEKMMAMPNTWTICFGEAPM